MPAAVVDSTLGDVVPLLARDDALVDGGNSYYHDDIRRAEKELQEITDLHTARIDELLEAKEAELMEV